MAYMNEVRDSYAARSAEYIRALGSIELMDDADKHTIATWSSTVRGYIVDAGCGPGHWTHFMARHGATAMGIDLTPAFISSAHQRFPSQNYVIADICTLPCADSSIGGILGWYSLIHMNATELDRTLREWHRTLRTNGSVLIGFFTGSHSKQFDHAITPAHYWPIEQLKQELEQCGFTIKETAVRNKTNGRDHGHIMAMKN